MACRNKIPSNWPDFLRHSVNKQELFTFLPSKIELTKCPEGKQIFTTSGTTVIARGTSLCMQSCDHEEADTRMLIHLQDALANGSTTCLVRTVDTDVVVTIIRKFHSLLTNYPAADIIWILLALAGTLCISTSMLSAMTWGETNLWHF